ncbi:YozQ family protein [Sutcliffiella deserti]|uniref:YozQ family protein n=1 Tax=Sutcliffiella deserti TaxID=2875501 RepID=UPI001CBC271F|nr:YozQ family protein [Sutcliffiella deserti]
MANRKKETNSTEIAGRIYEVEDYKRQDQLSQGLAETHEQVSDAYMAGETFQEPKNKK